MGKVLSNLDLFLVFVVVMSINTDINISKRKRKRKKSGVNWKQLKKGKSASSMLDAPSFQIPNFELTFSS